MRHATALLYHVCAVASRNIRFASCGTSGKLTLWTRYVLDRTNSLTHFRSKHIIMQKRNSPHCNPTHQAPGHNGLAVLLLCLMHQTQRFHPRSSVWKCGRTEGAPAPACWQGPLSGAIYWYWTPGTQNNNNKHDSTLSWGLLGILYNVTQQNLPTFNVPYRYIKIFFWKSITPHSPLDISFILSCKIPHRQNRQ
jgi:hypothetical protein